PHVPATMIQHPPTATAFPYTPLFRSLAERLNALGKEARQAFLDRFRRRPADLTAEEEGDAIEFVDQLEAKVSEPAEPEAADEEVDRKSTRLNSSHVKISYAVFCLKKN